MQLKAILPLRLKESIAIKSFQANKCVYQSRLEMEKIIDKLLCIRGTVENGFSVSNVKTFGASSCHIDIVIERTMSVGNRTHFFKSTGILRLSVSLAS